jgi:uncharacterized membrane protein YccF (DUF307 family)
MAQRSLLTRGLWFVFVGWWLTPILVNAAWLLGLTVVLLPISVKFINLVPTALTLKTPESTLDPEAGRGQHNLVVRTVWFVFVGWWASFIWANVANVLAITVIGLPVAIWMLHRLPFVLSLYRYEG